MTTARSLVDLEKRPPVWLGYPESKMLFDAVEKAGGQCRFVGGCVRDALLGSVSDDLDLCTDLLPETTLSYCAAGNGPAMAAASCGSNVTSR